MRTLKNAHTVETEEERQKLEQKHFQCSFLFSFAVDTRLYFAVNVAKMSDTLAKEGNKKH